jgi:hypothetical protein
MATSGWSEPNCFSFIATIGPTQVRKRLSERRELKLRHGIVFVERHEHADAHALARLRTRCKRPRCRKPDNELPPSHPGRSALVRGERIAILIAQEARSTCNVFKRKVSSGSGTKRRYAAPP